MHERILAQDTDHESWKKQISLFRAMTGSQRTALTLRLTAMVRETIRAGIRQRHPHYGEAKVQQALFRNLYGQALCDEVFSTVSGNT